MARLLIIELRLYGSRLFSLILNYYTRIEKDLKAIIFDPDGIIELVAATIFLILFVGALFT